MKKVLIVDDKEDVRKLLEIVLKSDDRTLCFACTGEQGVALAHQEKPDLILMDVMMPAGIDGYEATRILKASNETRATPILMMTAKAQEQDRADALACGADGYVGKPFDLADLKVKVERFLS